MVRAAQKSKPAKKDGKQRTYLSQSDVPAHSIDQAMRVPVALAEHYGKSPTKPLRVAQAMELSPQSSGFRMLCGASIAYGLTDGGYNSEAIALTPLGRRVVAPTSEGDDLDAKREALLRPRVIRDFLSRYDGSKLPSENIGCNVLEETGVPPDRAKDVFAFIVDGARSVGFLREVRGAHYVDLESSAIPESATAAKTDAASASSREPQRARDTTDGNLTEEAVIDAPTRKISRVFITHGRNKEIVSQLKEVLTFGGFIPVVAIDQESVSKPVPDKVLDDMRTCSAAIIHVGTETRLMDRDGNEHKMLNHNVLIEIGAAMALYNRQFILLVEQGSSLPSNLQGLYEVRYAGEKLDYEATMKLLKAFNDFRR